MVRSKHMSSYLWRKSLREGRENKFVEQEQQPLPDSTFREPDVPPQPKKFHAVIHGEMEP